MIRIGLGYDLHRLTEFPTACEIPILGASYEKFIIRAQFRHKSNLFFQ